MDLPSKMETLLLIKATQDAAAAAKLSHEKKQMLLERNKQAARALLVGLSEVSYVSQVKINK